MTKPSDDENRAKRAGDELNDMSVEEFRHYGHQVIDWIADYLSDPGRFPVLSQVEPGQIKAALPASPPREGEEMDAILADLDRVIVPGLTHWNHPSFFAYFPMNASIPGILGDIVATGMNVNAMMWRTSPAATELEEVTLDWLRQLIGLPEEFSGVIYDTASMASLCAIAAAREAVPGLHVREEGLCGLAAATQSDGVPNDFADQTAVTPLSTHLRIYVSEHAHSSVEKAAITLGIGQSGVKKITSDAEYRMDSVALSRAIDEDRNGGYQPFCVVATVGTTSTTSIDPVPEIARVCERERLWLHVDAAYGGSAAVVPEMKWVMAGCERADSFVINPHKWFFVPFDLSVLYCRRMDVLRQAFSLVPEYLRSANQDQVTDFMDYGPQLGRRFRALKLWFAMRYFGSEGLAARLRHHIEMAREFGEWVDRSPDFERMAPSPFSTICFRARPADLPANSGSGDIEAYLDSLNERLLEEVNREGKIFLSHTKLAGRFTLRLAVGHIRTTRDHVSLAWERLNGALSRLREV
jgi:aromatic-L-amino-acid decarboxylase